MGRPVVATDCVGIARQILADGTLGSLVPPRRSDLMAQAMNLELDRPHDVNRLRAAADPYRRDRSEDYLTAMDRCASRLAAG
jgi:glycosyltransferase involved in cell wall biosynthesis